MRYPGKPHTLPPAQAALLAALWGGLPYPAEVLIRQVFGSKTCSPDQKGKLSKRVSDLNALLKKTWGTPAKGKNQWITRLTYAASSAYQLSKPAGPPLNSQDQA